MMNINTTNFLFINSNLKTCIDKFLDTAIPDSEILAFRNTAFQSKPVDITLVNTNGSLTSADSLKVGDIIANGMYVVKHVISVQEFLSDIEHLLRSKNPEEIMICYDISDDEFYVDKYTHNKYLLDELIKHEEIARMEALAEEECRIFDEMEFREPIFPEYMD